METTVVVLVLIQVVIAAVLVLFLPISHETESVEPETIVALSSGQVAGVSATSFVGRRFVQFLNIPYAEPPMGHMRFARPQRLGSRWSNVRRSVKTSPLCLHLRHNIELAADEVDGQEDCLYLDVSRPDSCRSSACPVMVWFPPTQIWAMGRPASQTTFGPQLWMDYDVIFVAVRYRSGVLGFLTLDSDLAPGNLGLRDQHLALQWIQQEIRSFGGDPNRVTILGSGFGGASALLQMVSPYNQNSRLFHGIISQSGTPFFDPLMDIKRSGRHSALQLADRLNCSGIEKDQLLLHCLRTKDAKEIVALQSTFFEKVTAAKLMMPNPFVPTVDGRHITDPFLPDRPESLLANRHFTSTPLIVGDNSHEGILLMSDILSHPAKFSNLSETIRLLVLNEGSGELTRQVSGIVQVIKRNYFVAENPFRLHLKEGVRLFTDLAFHGKIGLTVRFLRKHSSDSIFHYLYKYSASQSFGDLAMYSPWKIKLKLFFQSLGVAHNMRNGYGVSHADELLQMFVMDHLSHPMGSGPISDLDRTASEAIMKSWIEFARSGSPSISPGDSDAQFHWIPSTEDQPRIAEITSRLKMVSDDRFWRAVCFLQDISVALGKGDHVLQACKAETEPLPDQRSPHKDEL